MKCTGWWFVSSLYSTCYVCLHTMGQKGQYYNTVYVHYICGPLVLGQHRLLCFELLWCITQTLLSKYKHDITMSTQTWIWIRSPKLKKTAHVCRGPEEEACGKTPTIMPLFTAGHRRECTPHFFFNKPVSERSVSFSALSFKPNSSK